MSQKYFVIIPAAGIGQRFCDSTLDEKYRYPKQYANLSQHTVLEHILSRFASVEWIDRIVVALHEKDTYFNRIFPALPKKTVRVIGGETRTQSVLNALKQVQAEAKGTDWVLVHDAVRPCLSERDLNFLKQQLLKHPVGGILAEKIVSTVKSSSIDQKIEETLDRDKLWLALTPQMFRSEILYSALTHCIEKNLPVTDESQAVEHLGYKPLLVQAHDCNIKITTQKDLILAAALLQAMSQDAPENLKV